MAKVILTTRDDRPLAELPRAAEALLAEAEEYARKNNLAKRSHFPAAVREAVEAEGYRVADVDLAAVVSALNELRRGGRVDEVRVRVTAGPAEGNGRGGNMAGKPPGGAPGQKYFETELRYPNREARARYENLVGLDAHKARLLLELELLLYPDRLEAWSRKHHGAVIALCGVYAHRPPLVLLEGDVGCGKTVLAESVGDPLAEMTGGRVTLLKVNTQVRGSGLVGEMTDLIVQAFAHAEARAEAGGGEPVLFLIDEADALAARRDEQHMHHEDKAGLNTLLQRIDGLRRRRLPVVVLFITNRPDALDPAIRRRAALQLTFGRPDDETRAAIFRRFLPELKLSDRQISELVHLTGPLDGKRKHRAGFTASDITDRLLPAALREAYAAGRPLAAADLVAQAKLIEPSPPFGGE